MSHVTVVPPLIVATAGTAGTLYIWWQHRRRLVIDAAAASLIGALRVELGVVHGILRGTLSALVRLTKARAAVLALEHCATRRLHLVVLAGSAHEDTHVRIRRIPRGRRGTYFFDAAPIGHHPLREPRTRTTATVQVLGLGRGAGAVPDPFRAAHPCRSLHGFAFRLGDDWNGRLFLLDPATRGGRNAGVYSIRALIEDLGPAFAGISELHALWRRAAANERARLGRELHDGILQELFAIDLELELHRHRALDDEDAARQLKCVQQRVQAQIANLRELTQRARSQRVDPASLPQVLHDLVERFARQTGIDACFVCESDHIGLTEEVCAELVQIVQEALINVRRHSGARHVLVRFGCEGREWRLSIQDDGCGFRSRVPGPGEAHRPTLRGPAVISERVQAIGGSLRLANPLEGGARLEIVSQE